MRFQCFHVASTGLPWWFNWTSLVLPWGFRHVSMVVYVLPFLPCCYRTTSVLLPLRFHGACMVLSWRFVFPWWCVRFDGDMCTSVASMVLPWHLPWCFHRTSMVLPGVCTVLPWCFVLPVLVYVHRSCAFIISVVFPCDFRGVPCDTHGASIAVYAFRFLPRGFLGTSMVLPSYTHGACIGLPGCFSMGFEFFVAVPRQCPRHAAALPQHAAATHGNTHGMPRHAAACHGSPRRLPRHTAERLPRHALRPAPRKPLRHVTARPAVKGKTHGTPRQVRSI